MKDVTCRPASFHDAKPILGLLKDMHAENLLAEPDFPPFDSVMVRAKIAEVLNAGTAFVVEMGGTVVASTGLEYRQWWFSRRTFLGDVWLYVDPVARGTRALDLLCDAAEQAAEKENLGLATGVLTAKDPERKNALFRRRAQRRTVGAMFVTRF